MQLRDIHKRVGQFEIDKNVINNFPTAVMEALSKCVVMRAEYLAVPDRVFYFGYSPEFDELSVGEPIPLYTVEYGPSGVRFRRGSDGY